MQCVWFGYMTLKKLPTYSTSSFHVECRKLEVTSWLPIKQHFHPEDAGQSVNSQLFLHSPRIAKITAQWTTNPIYEKTVTFRTDEAKAFSYLGQTLLNTSTNLAF